MIAQLETEHDRIAQMVPLADIKPHPDNDRLYGPVNPKDKDVCALAADIRQKGVLEPLVLTSDNYVLSGHRRRVAALLAGLREVPCVYVSILSDAPDILRWLATYNQQRVKTAAEMVREQIALANPEDSHQCLLHYRRRIAQIPEIDCFRLGAVKRRARISPAKMPFLDAILGVLEKYRKFWPLTVRQVHYALLNDPPLIHASKPASRYVNDKKSYSKLCDLVTRARLEGKIPFTRLHDPTRPVVNWDVFGSVQPFVREEISIFLNGYCRNLLQSQPNHIEIVGEKNTIDSIVRPLAAEYCIPYMIGRGYSSLTPRYQMAERYRKSGKEKMVLLFVSDFDPEGENIAHSFARSMRDDFGIREIHPVKVALTFEQVQQMQLPTGPKVKKKSSRAKVFMEKHGEHVWELEAIRPDQLQDMLRNAIDSVLDIDAFNAEIDREKEDAAYLNGVRRYLHKSLAGFEGLDADNDDGLAADEIET